MENNQYQELFLSESQEILSDLNTSLVKLEKQPADEKCLEEIFRHCHTLKGMAATMEYEKIVQLAHAMETVLSSIRKGKGKIKNNVITTLFSGLDLLGKLIDETRSGKKSTIEIGSLLERLQNLLHEVIVEPSSQEIADTVSPRSALAPTLVNTPATDLHAVTSIRVNLDRLETLMNEMGELVTNKIRLVELARVLKDKNLSDAVTHMERIANRLQDEVMQMRLIPLEYLMNYYPRLVRDAAHKLGKEIKFSMMSLDIGIDRTVLDEINDPLIHILRNAVCHGIETPEERKRLGKPIEGEIKITAHREKNFVVLSIIDDGYGLDREKIKNAILREGRMTADELAKLSDDEILMLVTLPGFSLSPKVTEESGRGVGMNVVRHKVEAIGGSLSIQSTKGKGCTIHLRLPLSMAIIRVLLIKIANETCAIPLVNIIETVKIQSQAVKKVDQQEIIYYRDAVLPLVYLREKLGYARNTQPGVKNKLSIVICELFNKKIAVMVDEFIREEEVVVKNLAGTLHGISGYSGATILSSGRVAMIVDIVSLIE